MIVRIKSIKPLDNYILKVLFDDGRNIEYDMKEDIETLPGYENLRCISGLWAQAKLDESRTCVFWNDDIDLPSDTLYEFGKEVIGF